MTPRKREDPFEHAALSMLIAASRRYVKQAIGTLGEPFDLNAYQYWMLWILRGQGPMSLSDLAARMWMDHPTTSRLVHAMEKEGLVQLSPDPNHGRRLRIQIAPDQQERVEAICAKTDAYRERFEQGLSEDELRHMRSGLAKVITNLEGLLDDWKHDGVKLKPGGQS